MKKHIPVIITVVIMLLLVGGVVGYAVVSTKPKTTTLSKKTTQTPSSTPSQLNATNAPSATQGNQQTLGVTNQPDSGATLQSNLGGSGTSGSQSNSSANTPALPGPDTFEQYEQYANEKGTMYMDVKVGEGEPVGEDTTVAMLYQGWLTDGTLFDQSRTNSEGKLETFNFKIGSGKVIQGWDQGITGMKVGGIRRLVVPPAFGYGAAGQGSIPPNAVLVFDVQLIQAQ